MPRNIVSQVDLTSLNLARQDDYQYYIEAYHRLIFDSPKEIAFKGRWFCFTGKFAFGMRSQCETAVLQRGALVSHRPTWATDYLVVGSLGGEGSKADEVKVLKRSGSPALILSETEWFAAVKKATVVANPTLAIKKPRTKRRTRGLNPHFGGLAVAIGFKDGVAISRIEHLPSENV